MSRGKKNHKPTQNPLKTHHCIIFLNHYNKSEFWKKTSFRQTFTLRSLPETFSKYKHHGCWIRKMQPFQNIQFLQQQLSWYLISGERQNAYSLPALPSYGLSLRETQEPEQTPIALPYLARCSVRECPSYTPCWSWLSSCTEGRERLWQAAEAERRSPSTAGARRAKRCRQGSSEPRRRG